MKIQKNNKFKKVLDKQNNTWYNIKVVAFEITDRTKPIERNFQKMKKSSWQNRLDKI